MSLTLRPRDLWAARRERAWLCANECLVTLCLTAAVEARLTSFVLLFGIALSGRGAMAMSSDDLADGRLVVVKRENKTT